MLYVPVYKKITLLSFPISSYFMFIILCNINYSDPHILDLILVNIKTLQKNKSLLEKTINSCRSLQALDVYESLLRNRN